MLKQVTGIKVSYFFVKWPGRNKRAGRLFCGAGMAGVLKKMD